MAKKVKRIHSEKLTIDANTEDDDSSDFFTLSQIVDSEEVCGCPILFARNKSKTLDEQIEDILDDTVVKKIKPKKEPHLKQVNLKNDPNNYQIFAQEDDRTNPQFFYLTFGPYSGLYAEDGRNLKQQVEDVLQYLLDDPTIKVKNITNASEDDPITEAQGITKAKKTKT